MAKSRQSGRALSELHRCVSQTCAPNPNNGVVSYLSKMDSTPLFHFDYHIQCNHVSSKQLAECQNPFVGIWPANYFAVVAGGDEAAGVAGVAGALLPCFAFFLSA